MHNPVNLTQHIAESSRAPSLVLPCHSTPFSVDRITMHPLGWFSSNWKFKKQFPVGDIEGLLNEAFTWIERMFFTTAYSSTCACLKYKMLKQASSLRNDGRYQKPGQTLIYSVYIFIMCLASTVHYIPLPQFLVFPFHKYWYFQFQQAHKRIQQNHTLLMRFWRWTQKYLQFW